MAETTTSQVGDGGSIPAVAHCTELSLNKFRDKLRVEIKLRLRVGVIINGWVRVGLDLRVG